RELILEEMKQHNESFADVVSSTISDELLDEKLFAWDNLKGPSPSNQRYHFTIWTHKRAYVPATICHYEGDDYFCASVSRNPDGIPTPHIGGG
ncbi:MAG: hypothetical protein ACKO34_07730, partial [Vampirovibrionales bacterium]